MKNNELPRFNMAYELGLDVGCMEYGDKKLQSKKILILEIVQYHYQKVLSDIYGQDIAHHNEDPKVAVKKVRDWLSTNSKSVSAGSTEIWRAYNHFTTYLLSNAKSSFTEREIREMQISDYIKFEGWIHTFRDK